MLQLSTRMMDPKPELRPVLSEVLRMIASNGVSHAGGLALDGSPIGAVGGKVGVRVCASCEPRHPAISDVATTECSFVCCYQPNWRQPRRTPRHQRCRIVTAAHSEAWTIRICGICRISPSRAGKRRPEAGQAGFADGCPRIFTPVLRLPSVVGFQWTSMLLFKPLLHTQVLTRHCNTNKHQSLAHPPMHGVASARAFYTKFLQRPVGDTVLGNAWMQSGSVAWLKQSRFVVAAGATTPSSYGASCCPWTSSQTVLGEQWRVLPGFWAPTALQQLLLQPAWSSSSSSPSSPCLPAWRL